MRLIGANLEPQVTGLDGLPGKANYFISNDPKKWRTEVSTYAKVQYKNVYPGIDLIYYGNQRQLEYDFIVAPGSDPKTVRLGFEGADKLSWITRVTLSFMSAANKSSYTSHSSIRT